MSKVIKGGKRKIAQKKPTKQANEFVIVGNYKEGQLAWIKKNGIYNYPVRKDDSFIASRIRTIRGVQVILDRDIAALYGVETKVLNQAVKRNAGRFPLDFMFQLDKEECLRSQIVTLNGKRGEHLKYMPYAFTENGVAMLSGVLRSPTAVETNIRIILDDAVLLHVGASLNHLGKRCFAFSAMDASNIPDILAKIP